MIANKEHAKKVLACLWDFGYNLILFNLQSSVL